MSKINQQPNNWKNVTLGDADYFDILSSGIKKFSGTKKYLSTSSIQNNNITNIESEITYNDRPSRANMQPILNSVWFAKMKDTLKVLEIKNQDLAENYILSTGFSGVVLKNGSSAFLNQIFLSDNFNRQKNSLSKGSTQKAININGIININFFLPPLSEQKQIAEILQTVDDDIEKIEQIIKKTEELKKGLLQQFFTMSNNYKVQKLENLCDNITDGKHGDCKNEENSGYYFVSVKDIYNGKIHYENARQITEKDFLETHRRTKLECGDILLTNSGTIGRIALIDENNKNIHNTTFQKSVAIIKPKRNLINNIFLSYFFNVAINSFLIQSSGSAQKNLLLKDLRSFDIPIIPLGEQKQIADILSSVDYKINIYKRIKNKLILLKKGLMQDLLSGKVRV